ncbi:MAG: MFS transporter, partial [Acidimicrobiia bacterium]
HLRPAARRARDWEIIRMGQAEDRAYERRWLILLVMCFSLLIIVLDNSILNVAIPTIIDELDATNSQIQWMVDSYTLVFAGLLLTAGSLGDRYGRRGALQFGLVVFGLGSLASAFAASADQLIVTRAFMGIGGAFIMPATLSIITNVFPANERGKAIGFWAGTAGLAGVLGPTIGGFLLEHFYWGSVFLVNIPIVVLGVLAGIFVIPTSKDPHPGPLDPIGAVLSIVGLVALIFAIIEAPQQGWTDPVILASFAVAVVTLAGFVMWEARSEHPMLDVKFFKNPRFSAASASISLIFFAMFGSTFLITQYFQFVLGYSPLKTGLCFVPFAVCMLIGAPLSAPFAQRVGTKVVVTLGLSLATVGLLSFTSLSTDSSYWPDVCLRLVLLATGMALTMAPATESIMGSLPLGKAGVGSAVNDTTRQVGGALGVAIIGSVLSSIYASKMGDFLAGKPVRSSNITQIKESLGATLGYAKRISEQAPSFAQSLASVAREAYVDGLHAAMIVAAIATLVGVVVAAVWLPARAGGAADGASALDGDEVDELLDRTHQG